MKRNPFSLFIGLLILVVFAFLLFSFQVRQSEVAVVTTFGKPTRPITEPGLHAKWPRPIQRVYKFDQRMQNFEDRTTEGQTREHFNVITSVYVGWRITDPAAFLPKFAGSVNPISEAERKLDERLGNIKMAVVSKHSLSDFISVSDNGTNLAAIEAEILHAIQSEVSSNNWGLEVSFLGLKRLQLPESVSKAVLERMQAERRVLADKSQYEGEKEASIIHSDADRRAADMVSQAESEAIEIRAKGEAQAAESLAAFKKNPELANFIFSLNALENSLKDRSILIFDQHTPPFDILRGVSTNLLNPSR
jgi:membrane protease subunit HflC